MQTFEWIIASLRCQNCEDLKYGVRIIIAVENKDIVNYGILCTHCHHVIIGDLISEDFWEMMNGVPPTDTAN